MKLFAGYDSGGSKTVCVLADERGRLLGTGRGGPSIISTAARSGQRSR